MQSNSFSNFEKKILKKVLNYKRKAVESTFKELFEEILNEFFDNIGIIITSSGSIKICFYKKTDTEYLIQTKERLYEIIVLFVSLKNEYNFFYNIPNNFKNFEHCIALNTRTPKTDINLKLDKENIIFLKLIYSNYFITSNLRECCISKFETIERKNLRYTRIALYISIIVSIISMFFNWYQLKSISEIKIVNPEEIKKDVNIFLLK